MIVTERAYWCERCYRWYRRASTPMGCCVMHPPGDCCHLGETPLDSRPPD